MIVLTAVRQPDDTPPRVATGPPDDPHRTEERMWYVKRELDAIQRRLALLLDYIQRDTEDDAMAPMDPRT